MLFIEKAQVYTPKFIGEADILVSGTKIVAIEKDIPFKNFEKYITDHIYAKNKIVVPGLIDAHVHIAGAGGEGGPATRTPEMKLMHMFQGGITTVIGCLGTDGYSRSPKSVLMKVKSIRDQGASAWMYTGAYQVPVCTITGEISSDILYIDEVIGVGEIALSDHRSSFPTNNELLRIASQARVAGMLAGKAGILNIHLGDAKNPFQPIEMAVSSSELSFRQFLPTHCNRNTYIFDDAKIYGKTGYVDITASSYPFFPEYEIKPSLAIKDLLNAGVPITNITLTSDGNGSLPDFDADGNLIKLEMGMPDSIFTEFVDMVKIEKLPVDVAIQVITSSVSKALKLRQKGHLTNGMDADILLLNPDFSISHLVAMGKIVVENGKIKLKGNYE